MHESNAKANGKEQKEWERMKEGRERKQRHLSQLVSQCRLLHKLLIICLHVAACAIRGAHSEFDVNFETSVYI